MVQRGIGRPVTEADLGAFRMEDAEGYRPGAEPAIEQVAVKHRYVCNEGADPTDDYYVLVGVTWARLRDFDPVRGPTRTVVNEQAYQTFASAMQKAFALGFTAGRVSQ
jgi:hypothetical protein